MPHREMRMQIDYFSLRNHVTCFKFIFFLHYRVHKEIHHLAKWALKKHPCSVSLGETSPAII